MKYEYEYKQVKTVNTKEIKKSIYKNPLSIFALLITVIIVLYVTVNLPKQRSIKAIKTTPDTVETF